MYLARTPWIITKLYPKRQWHMPRNLRKVYLTFDDGPTPEVTPWVLEQLAAYNALATFFCIGKNIVAQPSLFAQLQRTGHTIGNHTWSHLRGSEVSTSAYIVDVERVDAHLNEIHQNTPCALFRPPYGRITRKQAATLNERYRIVMWDILSGDYDREISSERCLANVLENIRPGSIIVFHDSLKAEPHLRYVLPQVLKTLQEQGYSMEAL